MRNEKHYPSELRWLHLVYEKNKNEKERILFHFHLAFARIISMCCSKAKKCLFIHRKTFTGCNAYSLFFLLSCVILFFFHCEYSAFIVVEEREQTFTRKSEARVSFEESSVVNGRIIRNALHLIGIFKSITASFNVHVSTKKSAFKDFSLLNSNKSK